MVDFGLETLEGRTILVVEGILVVGGGGVGVVEAGILADWFAESGPSVEVGR